MNRELQLDIAQSYLDRGQAQSAIDVLKQLLAEDPDDAYAHGFLASCLASQLRLHAAKYELQIALSLDPMLPFLHLVSARLMYLENKPKNAVSAAEEALSLHPQYVDALLFKSDVLLHMEKIELALDCIDQAAKLEPDSVDIAVAYGEFYLATGKLDKAHKYAYEALSSMPEDESANLLMGNIQLKNGNMQEAEYHAKFVIRNNPDSSAALSLFSNIKMRRNLFLGVWWKFNSWAATLTSIKMGFVLILGFLTFNLLAQVLYDLGYDNTSSVVSYTWLALVIYSWVGIPMYYRALKKELNKFSFNEDF